MGQFAVMEDHKAVLDLARERFPCVAHFTRGHGSAQRRFYVFEHPDIRHQTAPAGEPIIVHDMRELQVACPNLAVTPTLTA